MNETTRSKEGRKEGVYLVQRRDNAIEELGFMLKDSFEDELFVWRKTKETSTFPVTHFQIRALHEGMHV